MQSHLKNLSAAIMVASVIHGCNDSSPKADAPVAKNDTIVAQSIAPAKAPGILLKDAVWNEKTLLAGKKLYASPIVTEGEYKSLSIQLIDSSGNERNNYKYHLIDTLYNGSEAIVLLIGREYETENYAWLVVYDLQKKLKDHLAVYYDNAEGFLSITTKIAGNKIIITTLNDFAEAENEKKIVSAFHINDDGGIVKDK